VLLHEFNEVIKSVIGQKYVLPHKEVLGFNDKQCGIFLNYNPLTIVAAAADIFSNPTDEITSACHSMMFRANHELFTELSAYNVLPTTSNGQYTSKYWSHSAGGTNGTPGYLEGVAKPIIAMVAKGQDREASEVLKNIGLLGKAIEEALRNGSLALEQAALDTNIYRQALGDEGNNILNNAIALANQSLAIVHAKTQSISGLTLKSADHCYEMALCLGAIPDLNQAQTINHLKMYLGIILSRNATDAAQQNLQMQNVAPEDIFNVFLEKFNAMQGSTDRFRKSNYPTNASKHFDNNKKPFLDEATAAKNQPELRA
jgi:hypothetical protein